MDNIFSVRNLTFSYPNVDSHAIRDISFDINSGDFVVILGQSGCGKSTLLRHLKPQLTPHGSTVGRILYNNTPIQDIDERQSTAEIGFVMQSADSQIVSDKVWHELAFGLENLGYDNLTIRRKVAEMASFFGIQNWFYRDTNELSGGQKQLLNLASIMVMQPKVLILDEPTSQLDPIAASDFIAILHKINTEFGTTIIITEHRLEEVLPLATKVIAMQDGGILALGTAEQVGGYLRDNQNRLFYSMTSAMQIWGSVNCPDTCPICVIEGKKFLYNYSRTHNLAPIIDSKSNAQNGTEMVKLKGVRFKYSKNYDYVIKDLDLTANSGELLCVLGGNGTGKTTALKLIANPKLSHHGDINIYGKVGYLPQNPQALFVKDTVIAELLDVLSDLKLTQQDKQSRVDKVITLCKLNNLQNVHPYDLSGGEMQRLALAKVLLTEPEILLLDEITKGLDTAFKHQIANILQSLLQSGVCIIMVSHDIEFCANYADRCALFFDGNIVSCSNTREFFANNNFYTTSASKIGRDIIPNAITTKDIIDSIGGKININLPPTKSDDIPKPTQKQADFQTKRNKPKLSKQNIIGIATTILLIPVTLLIGVLYIDNYYATALAVLAECMLPFFVKFEHSKPTARQIVTISTLCALGVSGRAMFAMLPQFKPVIAIVVISGIALGSEVGFLVGAITMLVSNVLFAQGMWTPFQMFAMGIIGFLSGILYHTNLLKRRKLSISLFGAISSVVIYGGIMNPASALIYGADALNLNIILSYYATGLPLDMVQAVATFIFLYLISIPMLRILDRIKLKYL